MWKPPGARQAPPLQEDVNPSLTLALLPGEDTRHPRVQGGDPEPSRSHAAASVLSPFSAPPEVGRTNLRSIFCGYYHAQSKERALPPGSGRPRESRDRALTAPKKLRGALRTPSLTEEVAGVQGLGREWARPPSVPCKGQQP